MVIVVSSFCVIFRQPVILSSLSDWQFAAMAVIASALRFEQPPTSSFVSDGQFAAMAIVRKVLAAPDVFPTKSAWSTASIIFSASTHDGSSWTQGMLDDPVADPCY